MPIPQVVTNIANGIPAQLSDDIATTCAVIGASSSGVLTTKFFSRRADAITAFGDGPLVRGSVHCIDTARRGIIMQRCEASNPGEYDTIDNSEFTGTAEPAAVASEVPTNENEFYIEFVDGGTVGTSGITYRWSTEGGRIALSGLTRLGTAFRITFGSTGGAIDLDPPAAQVTAFVTRTNELRTDAIAHMALTTGTVHTSADTTSDDGIASACTNVATGISLLRTIVTALGLHFARGSGQSIHINVAGDNTTSLTAATAAVAAAVSSGSAQDAITALAAVTAAYALHLANTTAHTIADATNTVTSPVPTRGTVVAGDIIRCQTFAPYPSTNELAAAFAALAESDYTPGFILLPGRTQDSYAATISAGLNVLKDNGKPCRVIAQARRRLGSDATMQDFRDNLQTETDDVSDTRILWASTDALCTISEGAALVVPAERFTGFAINLAAYRITLPFWQTTWQVGKGQLPGVRLIDDDGVFVGWNEPTEIETRLQLLYRVPNALLGRPTVAAPDYTLAGDDERIKTFNAGLIEDEIIRVVDAYHWEQIGITQKLVLVSGTTYRFKDETLRQSLQRSAAARLQAREGLQAGVSDLDAADLVALDPLVTVSQGVSQLSFAVNWTPAYPTGRITTTIAVRVGA